jgi:hypothetical protein
MPELFGELWCCLKTIQSICFIIKILNPLSAQKVALVSTIEHVRLPGMVNLNEEGTLFISADKKNKEGARTFLIDALESIFWHRLQSQLP